MILDKIFQRARRALLFLWQRITRGFDDSETWSLDMTMARWLLPRFQRFRELERATLEREPGWEIDMDKIEWALKRVAGSWNYDLDESVQEGLELLGKNLLRMWW